MAIADTKGNAREEEEEVPAWFRCPISLEIMKDPVSLCTGVTYERCSIEKWLEENNTVCPATMQPLQSLQLTPNHTLRRLIQHWSESPPTSIPAQQPLRSTVQHLIQETSTASSLLTALQTFNTMAKSRSISLKDEDIVNLLVKLLCSYNDPHVLSQVAEILAFLIEESGGFPSEKFRDVKMLPLVQSLSLASHRHSAVKLLEAMSRDRICARQMSAKEVIEFLLESMDDEEENCRRGAAKTLRNVCMISRSARVRMAILGGVSRTTEMMNVSRDNRDKGLCLCLFDALSTTAEGREAMDDHTMCIGSVVRCLSGVSAEASEHAVGALWRVCVNCEDYDAIVNSGLVQLGIKKLLVLMQMDCCSPTTKLRANRLLKLFNSLTPSLVST